MDASTPIAADTWRAAYGGVQAALTALDAVLGGDSAAFALCRPPGHHCGADYMGGYCYLNNVAIAARAAQARGVRRVYSGMETGDDALLRFLRKPGSASDAVDAVVRLKGAGVAVSVIVMTGIGGDRFAAAHVYGTIRALSEMPLVAGDIVYFSPFVNRPSSEYGRLAIEAGIRPLSAAEIADQEAAIRAGLRFHDPAHPPQCARYDIREFVY